MAYVVRYHYANMKDGWKKRHAYELEAYMEAYARAEYWCEQIMKNSVQHYNAYEIKQVPEGYQCWLRKTTGQSFIYECCFVVEQV